MVGITPLVVAFWMWVGLWVYWIIAGLFAHKTRQSESLLWRLQHLVPLFLAFYLIFNRHRWILIPGELYYTDWGGWPAALGLVLTTAGLAFTIYARIHLGRYWSGVITLKEGHRLITTGPYRLVRHPIYSGWLVAMAGSALTAGTVEGFLAVVMVGVAFRIKLGREERLLGREFGEEYAQFKREVPAALVPLFGLGEVRTPPELQSTAYQAEALRSEQRRIGGLLVVVAGYLVLNLTRLLASNHAAEIRRFTQYSVFWIICGSYELILLWAATRALRRGRAMRTWVTVLNTVVECIFPSVAALGLTRDATYLGPYRSLESGILVLYCLFIILTTLRLSPWLCVLAGAVCSAGYFLVYQFTLWTEATDPHRQEFPPESYPINAALLLTAGLLAAAIAAQIRRHVVAALKEAETRMKLDRVEHDLQIARSIQMGLLPKKSPEVAGYEIAGWSLPADQTGGDYYDWMELPGVNGQARSGRVMVTIADATGHGIGPALLATACRAYFRALATHDDPLETITRQVDALLEADIPAGRFITAAVALLVPEEHRLMLYSAGHAPLYLYTAEGDRVEMFDADQLPLGVRMDGGEESKARKIEMKCGDMLVLVTDGFFECADGGGRQLGMEGLGEAIRRHHGLSPKEMIGALHAEVLGFTGGVAQGDDLTAVVIKRVA